MPSWFTTFHPSFALPGRSRVAIEALARIAGPAGVPPGATWRVYRRGIGLVVTAEWPYGAPGATPASEINVLMGVPVLVEAKNGPE